MDGDTVVEAADFGDELIRVGYKGVLACGEFLNTDPENVDAFLAQHKRAKIGVGVAGTAVRYRQALNNQQQIELQARRDVKRLPPGEAGQEADEGEVD